MEKLKASELWTLEEYARQRDAFRARLIEHRKNRRVAVGGHVALCFEDRLTIQYQIQEMLRAERIFEPELVQEELAVYNPLIPNGKDWRATMMIEFKDPVERQRQLARLLDIDRKTWVGAGNGARVYAVSDEDLERQTESKTAAVHFLRFELGAENLKEILGGAPIRIGVDHENYNAEVVLCATARAALVKDLDN